MGLLSSAELHPMQEARRVAEVHLEEIRQIALSRVHIPRGDDAEADRFHKIAAVVDALQTIYDNVSALEFEEEPEPEPELPPEPPEEDEDEPYDDEPDEDAPDDDE